MEMDNRTPTSLDRLPSYRQETQARAGRKWQNPRRTCPDTVSERSGKHPARRDDAATHSPAARGEKRSCLHRAQNKYATFAAACRTIRSESEPQFPAEFPWA